MQNSLTNLELGQCFSSFQHPEQDSFSWLCLSLHSTEEYGIKCSCSVLWWLYRTMQCNIIWPSVMPNPRSHSVLAASEEEGEAARQVQPFPVSLSLYSFTAFSPLVASGSKLSCKVFKAGNLGGFCPSPLKSTACTYWTGMVIQFTLSAMVNCCALPPLEAPLILSDFCQLLMSEEHNDSLLSTY